MERTSPGDPRPGTGRCAGAPSPVLEKVPDSITCLKRRAQRAEGRGDWTGAIALYTDALRASHEDTEGPIDVSLYSRLGDLRLRLGEAEAAVACYELGILRYRQRGEHVRALALCSKVLRIMPARVSVHLHLGGLFSSTHLEADAREHYERFLRRMSRLDHEADALDVLEELVRDSGDAQAKAALLDWIWRLGDEAEAVGRLRALWRLEGKPIALLEGRPSRPGPGRPPSRRRRRVDRVKRQGGGAVM